jgi:hypothetical protein
MDLPELESTPRTTLYPPHVLDVGVEKIGREGFWLVLSIHHYGWRAHADMAGLLLAELDPLDLGEHHREHRAMAATEELFLLLDQLWRLVNGIMAHRAGGDFLTGYRKYSRDVSLEFEALRGLMEDDWREIFGLPTDDELEPILAGRGVASDLDAAREVLADMLRTTVTNMHEITVFFVRADPVFGATGKSLRDLNNTYRHGTQVVYEDASPAEIPWRAANPTEAEGMLVAANEVDALARKETVNVLLEGPDDEGHARFASVPRSTEVNASLIESMHHLSILLWRVATAYIVKEILGGPILSAMAPFTWEELDERYRDDERRLSKARR